MKKILPILTALILILAVFLRVYKLDQVPPALFGDEIDVGYQAYSLLTTGRDLSNRFLPFYVKSLSEYRTPLYIYSDIPFIGIFGLNEWGVRLPAAFWGVISIIGFYFLLTKLFGRRIGVIGAFLMTVSPWQLQYSRASFEVTMLLSFIIFGIYFFILGLEKKYYLIPAVLLLGLSIYIYSTAVVFVPLLVILLFLLNWKNVFTKNILFARKWVYAFCTGLVLIISLPLFYSIFTGVAKERFSIISIFQESVLLDKLNIARKGEIYFDPAGVEHKINFTQEALFHNKPLIFGQIFLQNYLRSFSFDFLFSSGDPNFRQSIFEMGELYIYELPLIIFGIFILFKKYRKERNLILGWLLIAPVPAALTSGGGYHATRLILILPALLILATIGLDELLSLKFRLKKVLLSGILILALANYFLYFHRYYIHYPVESWRWWQVGFKEALNEVNKLEPKYNKVIINNTYEPSLIRYLFYSKYDPAKFHQQFTTDQMIQEIEPGIKGFKLNEKVAFGYLTEKFAKEGGFESVMKPGMLYLVSARDEANGGDLRTYPHTNFVIIKTIVNPKNQPIFYILAGK